MIWFAAKTLLGAAFRLLLAAAIIFFALDLVSGEAPGWAAANARFWHWLALLFTGDFGESRSLGQPVGGLILTRLAVTVPLVVIALVLAGALGMGVGYAAGRGGAAVDRGFTALARAAATVPGLWIGLLLILLFAALLHWLPAGGFVVWTSNPGLSLVSLLLPALALALPPAGVIAIALRDGLREARTAPYFRAALARGLSDTELFRRHVLPNIAVRVLDGAGQAVVSIVPASLIIETVFSLPGVGRLLLDAAVERDVPVVTAGLVVVLLGMLLLTIALRAVRAGADPRLRQRTAT